MNQPKGCDVFAQINAKAVSDGLRSFLDPTKRWHVEIADPEVKLRFAPGFDLRLSADGSIWLDVPAVEVDAWAEVPVGQVSRRIHVQGQASARATARVGLKAAGEEVALVLREARIIEARILELRDVEGEERGEVVGSLPTWMEQWLPDLLHGALFKDGPVEVEERELKRLSVAELGIPAGNLRMRVVEGNLLLGGGIGAPPPELEPITTPSGILVYVAEPLLLQPIREAVAKSVAERYPQKLDEHYEIVVDHLEPHLVEGAIALDGMARVRGHGDEALGSDGLYPDIRVQVSDYLLKYKEIRPETEEIVLEEGDAKMTPVKEDVQRFVLTGLTTFGASWGASKAWWVTLPPLGILAGAARLVRAAVRFKRKEDGGSDETTFSTGISEKIPGIDVWLEDLAIHSHGVFLRADLVPDGLATQDEVSARVADAPQLPPALPAPGGTAPLAPAPARS